MFFPLFVLGHFLRDYLTINEMIPWVFHCASLVCMCLYQLLCCLDSTNFAGVMVNLDSKLHWLERQLVKHTSGCGHVNCGGSIQRPSGFSLLPPWLLPFALLLGHHEVADLPPPQCFCLGVSWQWTKPPKREVKLKLFFKLWMLGILTQWQNQTNTNQNKIKQR